MSDRAGEAAMIEVDGLTRAYRRGGVETQVLKGVFGYMGTDAAGLDDWDDRIVVPLATSARRLLNRA